MQAEEVGRITDDARRDGNIGNDEGDRVGVIGQEISDPAEAVFLPPLFVPYMPHTENA